MTRFLTFHRDDRRRAVDDGGPGVAGDTVSADKILDALKPKPATRGLSAGSPQVDTAAQAKEASFVNTLRNRKTRSLSLGERQEIAETRRDQAEDRSGDPVRLQLGRHQQELDAGGAGTRQGAVGRRA